MDRNLFDKSRTKRLDTDERIVVAQKYLEDLKLTPEQSALRSLTDLQKTLFALKLLLEFLAKAVASKVGNGKIKEIVAGILQAFIKSALMEGAQPPPITELVHDAEELLKHRFSEPNTRQIRSSIISTMSGAEESAIRRAVKKALRNKIKASMITAVANGNEAVRLNIRVVWKELMTPKEDREKNWEKMMVMSTLKMFISVVSIGTAFNDLEEDLGLSKWRNGLMIQIIDLVLGFALPGEELSKTQFETFAMWIDDARIGSVMGEELSTGSIRDGIESAMTFLEPEPPLNSGKLGLDS